jgi:hypothetical protein
MNFHEFLALNESDQFAMVVGGLPKEIWQDNEHLIFLQQVNNFFVEVTCNIEKSKIIAIKPVETYNPSGL